MSRTSEAYDPPTHGSWPFGILFFATAQPARAFCSPCRRTRALRLWPLPRRGPWLKAGRIWGREYPPAAPLLLRGASRFFPFCSSVTAPFLNPAYDKMGKKSTVDMKTGGCVERLGVVLNRGPVPGFSWKFCIDYLLYIYIYIFIYYLYLYLYFYIYYFIYIFIFIYIYFNLYIYIYIYYTCL